MIIYCLVCGRYMRAGVRYRSDAKTCSDRCRKRLSRKNHVTDSQVKRDQANDRGERS